MRSLLIINQNNMPKSLEITDFTNHPAVKKCMDDLKKQFPGTPGKELIVSDVLDGHGNQYVNLVQKGGGVLGIALVGYTYILEEMGIRFLRLAGTSAGAINTALMTVIGDDKTVPKSREILKDICALNFFDLVDGNAAAKWLIRTFITHKNFSRQAKNLVSIIFGLLAFFVVADIVFLGLQHTYPILTIATKISFILTGFYLMLLAALAFYISTLVKRLKESGFGINPGDFFYDWIKKRLCENHVVTVADLNKKALATPDLHLRTPHPHGTSDLKGDVTFITSELVSQNKIEFPKMCNLFRTDINLLQPAGFIRASMSIPIFFESYYINDIPCEDDQIKKAWCDTFGEDNPPSKARFVDGGILSNFPINIFYNKDVVTPRLPSFGINLDDSTPESKTNDAAQWSLLSYIGRMFNTIRFYYDKDFFIKNRVFSKGVGTIPLAKYNWLNFFLTDKDKIDMFVLGAQAATDFLGKFKWEEFKAHRKIMHEQLEAKETAK